MTHPHYTTGLPCNCSFTAHLEPAPDWGRLARRIEADAIEDLAGNRRLQSPAGQNFVHALWQMRDSSMDPDKIEPMLPWLAREFRKGRLQHDWLEHALAQHASTFSEDLKAHLRDYHIRGQDPQVPGMDIPGLYNSFTGQAHPLTFNVGQDDHRTLASNVINHWGDFLRSGHPLAQQLGDLNHYSIQDFHQRVEDWDRAMEEAAKQKQLEALQGGEVVHTTPDGYTIRRLTKPEELEAEGDAMGHCVGGYHGAVESGRSLIYSLRDPQGQPHVTTEIRPTRKSQAPPFDIERALSNHSVLHRAPEELKNMLRAYGQNPDWSAIEDMKPNLPEWDDVDGRSLGQLFNTLVSTDRENHEHPIPHGGEVVQIQGKGNREPIDEYKKQMADWFRSFPPEDRPGSQADEEYMQGDDGYSHSQLDHPDLIPQFERAYGSLNPGPGANENEYGLIRRAPQIPADYDALLDKIKYHDYGSQGGAYDTDHIDDIYRLARERGEIPQLGDAASDWEQRKNDEFFEWQDMNYDYMPRYPDEPSGWVDHEDNDVEEEHPEAKPYWEVMPNGYGPERHFDQDEAEKEYDEQMGYITDEVPGLQAVSRLYNHLNQHQTAQAPDGSGQYTNDLKPLEPEAAPPTQPQATAFSKTASDEPSRPQSPGMPPDPGSTPIPPGNVRLWHYTGASPEEIYQGGLQLGRARGESYGEPNQIWASAQPPSFDNHNVVEFSVPVNDPRWDIGKHEPYINYASPDGDSRTDPDFDYGQYLHDRGSHVTFRDDIRPEEIIGVHEPWHQSYRYLMEHYPTPESVTEMGGPSAFDWALKDDPGGLGRAVQEWKKALWPSEPKLSAALYKRWVFSPASGKVDLADNSGDPLDVKYHTDLARERNEPNLVHGFAYKIGGGWRLTDWESKPVTDPFVVASVMRALVGDQSSQEPAGEDWPEMSDPNPPQWDRVHHGIPG